MKYALDASVGMKWVLNEPDSPKACHLRDDARNQVHVLIAPDVFSLEIAHGLAKAQRQGHVSDSESLWLTVMSDCPSLHTSLPLMRRALQIANQARIGVYDCLYVGAT